MCYKIIVGTLAKYFQQLAPVKDVCVAFNGNVFYHGINYCGIKSAVVTCT